MPSIAMSNESRRLTPLDSSRHTIIPAQLRCDQVTAFPTAMIDSGATANFISKDFVEQNSLPTIPKEFPRHPVAVDGRPLGVVNKEVRGTLRLASHEEDIALDVASTGRHPVILGAP